MDCSEVGNAQLLEHQAVLLQKSAIQMQYSIAYQQANPLDLALQDLPSLRWQNKITQDLLWFQTYMFAVPDWSLMTSLKSLSWRSMHARRHARSGVLVWFHSQLRKSFRDENPTLVGLSLPISELHCGRQWCIIALIACDACFKVPLPGGSPKPGCNGCSTTGLFQQSTH